MTPNERASACFLATAGNRPLVWTQDGVNFRADDIDLTNDGTGIIATLTAWTGQGTNAIYLPVDNPYIIINPPTQIPDGGRRTVPNATGTGVSVVDTYVYDPLNALKLAFSKTVIQVARDSGWSG